MAGGELLQRYQAVDVDSRAQLDGPVEVGLGGKAGSEEDVAGLELCPQAELKLLDGDGIEPGSFFLEQAQDFDRAEGFGCVENPVRERSEGGVKGLKLLQDGLGVVGIKGCSVGFAEGFRVDSADELHFRCGGHGPANHPARRAPRGRASLWFRADREAREPGSGSWNIFAPRAGRDASKPGRGLPRGWRRAGGGVRSC